MRHIIQPNPDQRPVRIQAGALGRDLPLRDLVVSPDHALLFDDMLIPARQLLGTVPAIAQMAVDAVQYFHILLERHDVLIAEGVACESLLEICGDAMFDNEASAPETLAFLDPCAPRVTQGEKLEAIRNQLRQLHVDA